MNRTSHILLALLAASLFLAPAPRAQAVEETTPAPSEKSSRLQGRAALARRRPVMGATVRIQPQDDRSRLYLTSTGDRGEFQVDDLPDGEYRLHITREGLTPVGKDKISVKFPFRAVVEVTMVPDEGAALPAVDRSGPSGTVTVLGHVLEQEGDPLGEVQVRLVRPDGTHDPRSLRSLPEGRFELRNLPAGPWQVELNGIGFLPVRQVLDFEQDARVTVYLVKQPAGYVPSPLELMPPEFPVPPAGWNE